MEAEIAQAATIGLPASIAQGAEIALEADEATIVAERRIALAASTTGGNEKSAERELVLPASTTGNVIAARKLQ